MAEAAADGEIRAAGAVLWQPAGRGIEVALVHRQRYDDWSFPKGKLYPGEHVLLAAVREVTEETGVRPILGRPLPMALYDRDGRPKRVDYWAGRPAPGGGRVPFRASDEVDALAWLPVPAARGRLSYPHDAAMLDEFAAGPADTVPFVFLRHSAAGRKGTWPGDDVDRPLDIAGVADSERLAGLLSCFGPLRVVSSATERCVATVRPYAELAGTTVEIEPVFTIGNAASTPGAAAARVTAIVTAGVPAVICAHRENLPSLLAAACATLGAPPPEGRPLAKSGFWVLHAADGALVAVEQHDLADP
jgi:8-oxo-(d)GTP phosphatase